MNKILYSKFCAVLFASTGLLILLSKALNWGTSASTPVYTAILSGALLLLASFFAWKQKNNLSMLLLVCGTIAMYLLR
jgi:hypothetical protein